MRNLIILFRIRSGYGILNKKAPIKIKQHFVILQQHQRFGDNGQNGQSAQRPVIKDLEADTETVNQLMENVLVAAFKKRHVKQGPVVG